MNLKQGQETILLFKILDYNKKENLLKNVKILQNNEVLDDFQVISETFKKVLIFQDNNKKQKVNIIFSNDKLNIELEAELIKDQINYIYPMINNINKNSIDFRYKNFTKKESIKYAEINFHNNKTYKLFYNFIDIKEKVGRCILLNVPNIYSIKYKQEYLVNDNSSNYWIYSVKHYENIIDFTQTKSLISNSENALKNENECFQEIAIYKNSICILLNENENLILKLVNLGKKKTFLIENY